MGKEKGEKVDEKTETDGEREIRYETHRKRKKEEQMQSQRDR